MEVGKGEVKTITIGSLFDGIGGFPLAGQRNGMTALWASEIEPFPIKVTKIRFPNMKHLGDITKIDCNSLEPVDIITGGSPCQDLSVAGKRAGLAGARSGLFMEQIRIVRELREIDKRNGRTGINIRPRFMVWENVPGAFSSNKGEDFRAVLEEICRVKDETVIIPEPPKGKWSTVGAIMGNGYSIAWRVLDAQYWGVPQRRRRIFLVADFGGQSAPEILFKREGLSRHLTESGETREGITADVERSAGETKQYLFENHSQDTRYVGPLEVSPIVSATFGMGGNNQPFVVNETYSIQGSMIGRADKNGPQGDGVNEDVSFTLNTTDRHAVAYGVVSKGNGEAWVTPERHMALNTGGGQAGQGYPAVLTQEPKVYGICSDASNSMKSDNPHSGIYEAETSRTLDLNGGSPACNQGGMAIVQKVYESHPMDSRITGPVDVSPTVSSKFHKGCADTPLVQCIEPGALSRGQGERVWDKCPTLRANMGDNQPCVVFNEETITSKTNASNPKPGDPCHTLGATGAGRTIVLNDQGGSQMSVSNDVVATLRAEMHGNIPAVCHSIETYHCETHKEKALTLKARDWKDPQCVTSLDCRNLNENVELSGTLQSKQTGGYSLNYTNPICQHYSVRRLTPMECERLQGFPDGWTDIPGQTEATQEELEFWREVWFTWDKTQAEEPERVKPRTDKAILKWLKNPVSDSAQYKALGNSVAVPCPEYVMEGIKEVMEVTNEK